MLSLPPSSLAIIDCRSDLSLRVRTHATAFSYTSSPRHFPLNRLANFCSGCCCCNSPPPLRVFTCSSRNFSPLEANASPRIYLRAGARDQALIALFAIPIKCRCRWCPKSGGVIGFSVVSFIDFSDYPRRCVYNDERVPMLLLLYH